MKKKIGIISLLTLISIIAIIPKSYGAIASKPTTKKDGSNVTVNSSITNSYMVCQQMKNSGESLYGTTVRPHLATNKDWGAVSYLSNSVYGTNTAGQNTGVEVEINGVTYYSTTGNASGVMNWGSNPYKTLYSQTSGIIQAYMNLADTSTSSAHDNVIELENAARNNSEYVEVINTSSSFNSQSTSGMAMVETRENSFVVWKHGYSDVTYPISIRRGLFEYVVGNYRQNHDIYTTTDTSGKNSGSATFRPIVWN